MDGKSKPSKKVQTRLPDLATEADEMFQNAGEKGTPQQDAEDVPRCRANNRRGLGTMANDRPPIQGVVGRTSGQIRLTVCENTQQQTIQPKVERATSRTATVYTDESSAYNHVSDTGRAHHTVCHSHREYARDDDGDGIREVHCNTMEGIWTGLRNFLRPFRGVHKKYLAQYVAVFEWAHNLKTVTATFLRLVMKRSISNPI
jgi:transposase-like protein